MKGERLDPCAQHARYRMGWMTPTERRKAGRPSACVTCRHFELESGSNEWGEAIAQLRCSHPMTTGATGFATAESAVCDQWEPKA